MTVEDRDIQLTKDLGEAYRLLIKKTTDMIAKVDIKELQAIKKKTRLSDAEFVGNLRMMVFDTDPQIRDIYREAVDKYWKSYDE